MRAQKFAGRIRPSAENYINLKQELMQEGGELYEFPKPDWHTDVLEKLYQQVTTRYAFVLDQDCVLLTADWVKLFRELESPHHWYSGRTAGFLPWVFFEGQPIYRFNKYKRRFTKDYRAGKIQIPEHQPGITDTYIVTKEMKEFSQLWFNKK